MLADAMYRETSGTAGGGNGGSRPQGGPQSGPQAGDVVDAEFKDADDRKP
jgi:hypothetical protein